MPSWILRVLSVRVDVGGPLITSCCLTGKEVTMKLAHWVVALVGLGMIGSTFGDVHPEYLMDRIGLGIGLLIVALMIQVEVNGRK